MFCIFWVTKGAVNWKVIFREKNQVVVLTYTGSNSAKNIFESTFSVIELIKKRYIKLRQGHGILLLN